MLGGAGGDAVEDSVLYMESLLKAQIECSGSFVPKLDKWPPQYCDTVGNMTRLTVA